MRGARRIAILAVVTAVVMLAGLVAPSAASASGSIKVLLSGLNSPKALTLAGPNGLVVGQGAFGAPGPVLEYNRKTRQATPLTPPVNVVDLITTDDGGAWALAEGGDLIRHSPEGTDTVVVNIPEYQETDPDPYDQEDAPTESNPYGLAALPNGDALVADAAGNDLLRVTQGGDVTTVARFDVEAVSTDHVPAEFGPLPPTIDAEAVPTAVTLGPNGWVYVGQLKGFPFKPGTSRVWAVNPDADGALCSAETPDPDCKIAYEGFTAIQDIYFLRQTATLYVYELARDGVLAFEAGFESGDFPPAVLLEVKKNKTTELAKGKLSEPGGIVALNRGEVFVTDGMFACSGPEGAPPCEGRLVEVHR
ncbi:MAG: ScyD/ScyE family protein [Actinomycetota bacterium]